MHSQIKRRKEKLDLIMVQVIPRYDDELNLSLHKSGVLEVKPSERNHLYSKMKMNRTHHSTPFVLSN